MHTECDDCESLSSVIQVSVIINQLRTCMMGEGVLGVMLVDCMVFWEVRLVANFSIGMTILYFIHLCWPDERNELA